MAKNRCGIDGFSPEYDIEDLKRDCNLNLPDFVYGEADGFWVECQYQEWGDDLICKYRGKCDLKEIA
jgi:hypothetical protein